MNRYLKNVCAKQSKLLCFAAIVSSLAATGLHAQEEEVMELEAFEVTGSLIPISETALDAKAIPVLRLERADIDKYGYANTSQFLRNLNVNNGGGVPIGNNATGFTPGASSVSLRGMGPDATLVLVNGKRVAPYPRGDSGTTAFVDLNSIPMEAIESIEVLKDGASATYGADAVAGVVNIKLREDYEGTQIDLRYGNTGSEDSSEFGASLLHGGSVGRLNYTVGTNYYKRNAIFNRDRDYSQVPPFLSSNARPVNANVSYEAIEEAYLSQGQTPPAGIYDTDGSLLEGSAYINTVVQSFVDGSLLGGVEPTSATGLLPIEDYELGLARFNFNLTSGAFPEQTRKGAFATFEYQVFEDQDIYIYGDFYYNTTKTRNELAPTATGNFGNPTGVSIVVPARTTSPIGGRADDVPADAFNPFNPFNEDVSGRSRTRVWEAGNRIFIDTTDAYLFTLGMRAEEIGGSSWNLDIGGRYSRLEADTESYLLNVTRFNEILNQASPIFQPGGEFEGQDAFNLFNSYTVDIENNFDIISYAQAVLYAERESDIITGNLTLTNGELFELPAGYIGFASGLELREESLVEAPDPQSLTGDIAGSSTATITDATRDAYAVFVELDVPIVSPEMEIPLVYNLGLQVAGRYEDFSSEGDTTFVPKIAGRYAPTDDIVFRASWGEGYRQPSLFELYAEGSTSSLTGIRDPLTGESNPEVDITTASSPDLEAEETTTTTVGFVFTPTFLPGFTMSVDYWDIEREGKVFVNHQDVVLRDFNGQDLLPGESVVRDGSNEILLVNGVFRNIGTTKTDGYDISASYSFATENYGFFEIGGSATYVNSFKEQDFEGAPFHEYVGFPTDILFQNFDDDGNPTPDVISGFDASDDGYLEWKGLTYFQYNYADFGLRLTANYTDGYKDRGLDPDTFESFDREVSDTWIYDVQLNYAIAPGSDDWYGSIDVTLGINNFTDEDPPFVSGEAFNSTGYPGFLYTPEGRFYYISLSKKL